MSTSPAFQALADDWAAHCRRVAFSSRVEDYLNHPAFHELVALGESSLPRIIDRYRVEDLPWGFVLQEITGVPLGGDRARFQPAEMRRQWLSWWESRQKQTP